MAASRPCKPAPIHASPFHGNHHYADIDKMLKTAVEFLEDEPE